jgi:hypothetical protein
MAHTALGPLPFAIQRAMQRNNARGADSPVLVLEIGAGHRFVAAGLKAHFGDQLHMHEVSPKYGALDGVIDRVFPPAKILDAELPADSYELIYSIYGSYYSGKQLDVLQKVVDAVRVGGEIFLMWKGSFWDFRNELRGDLINSWAAAFSGRGLDLAVEHDNFGTRLEPEVAHVVWARKLRREVDVRSMFREARTLQKRYRGASVDDLPEDLLPRMRLGYENLYFPAMLFEEHHLNQMIGNMLKVCCDTMGIDFTELERKVLDPKAPSVDEASARDMMVRYMTTEIGLKHLMSNVPMASIVLKLVSKVVPHLGSNATIPEIEAWRGKFHQAVFR